eukprot:1159877-Pelagomonas_calceolata.AAC.15
MHDQYSIQSLPYVITAKHCIEEVCCCAHVHRHASLVCSCAQACQSGVLMCSGMPVCRASHLQDCVVTDHDALTFVAILRARCPRLTSLMIVSTGCKHESLVQA